MNYHYFLPYLLRQLFPQPIVDLGVTYYHGMQIQEFLMYDGRMTIKDGMSIMESNIIGNTMEICDAYRSIYGQMVKKGIVWRWNF